MDPIANRKEESAAELERGIGLLRSLRIVVNVLYALMIFQVFLILPRPDDPLLSISTLPEIYAENLSQLLVILVGLVLIFIYWGQTNLQLGNLVRSKPTHSLLALIQMVCLMLYLYFVRLDMELDGIQLALQMESVFLALAGFIGVYNWRYARRHKLTSDQITDEEEMAISYRLLPEPIVSAFTFPFAVFGPDIWTLAWLALIPVTFVINRIKKRSLGT